jgi:drug/metabolite transporter (DMT)-like permease
MANQNLFPTVNPGDNVDDEGKIQPTRHERLSARRAGRRSGEWRWIGGVLLIGLGVLFLLQNAGFFTQFANWWALFLLLPAAGTFSAGLAAYRRDGNQWTRESIGPALAGLLFLGMTIVFLFGLNLSLFGPLLLIGAGVLVLIATR